MGNIKLLDCTLRDGGYVNDWNWGKETIEQSVKYLNETGVEIIEVGFIRDVEYDDNVSVYSSMDQVKKVIGKKKTSVQYAVMAEISNPIPLSMIEDADADGPDIVRVICWKTKHTPEGEVVDALQESYEYCKGFVEKGYKVCVQPNRVDQYSDEEFIEMLKLFSTISPMAIYVVDSWGTLYSDQILHYMHLADSVLPKNIAVGYHGHNNLMQAFANAETIIKEKYEREIIIDASIYGVGRGAGNLNLELVARYMNMYCDKRYSIEPMMQVYDHSLYKLYISHNWGYSFPYFITAFYNANPNFADYYVQNKYNIETQNEIIRSIPQNNRIIFDKNKASMIASKYQKKTAIIIPTCDDWAGIERILLAYTESFAKTTFSLWILNFGIHEKTKVAIENYLLTQEYDIHYVKIREEEFYVKAIECAKTSEYIWICKDCLTPDFDKFVSDNIFSNDVDAFFLNTFYEDCNDEEAHMIMNPPYIMQDAIVKVIALGGVILKKNHYDEMIKQIHDYHNNAFWFALSLTKLVGKGPVKILDINKWMFLSNDGVAFNCMSIQKNPDSYRIWTKDWKRFSYIMSGLGIANNNDVVSCYPFSNLWNVIFMRYKNSLTPIKYKELKKYQDNNRKTAMSLIAHMPRKVAQEFIVNRYGREVSRIMNIYRKTKVYKED